MKFKVATFKCGEQKENIILGEEMKIVVLGSGGFGYPLAFCGCEYCSKARELGGKNIRKRASILINDEMLIDLYSRRAVCNDNV